MSCRESRGCMAAGRQDRRVRMASPCRRGSACRYWCARLRLAGGGSTRRENNSTITDQALFVSLSSDTLDELQGFWQALAVEAVIVEPLAASAWSPGFGMLTDRFAVTWSLSVNPT